MTEFVLHENFHHFLFSPFFNTIKKPRLKVKNLKIEQFATLPKQKQKHPQKSKAEIREHDRTKNRNERTTLINKTIELIYDKCRPMSQSDQYRRNSLTDRNLRKSQPLSHSVKNQEHRHYQIGLAVNQEEERMIENKQYLSNAFRAVNFRKERDNAKDRLSFNRYETQVLSVDLKRSGNNESNYTRFAQRNKRRVEERHRRYTNSMNKSRVNTANLRTEKKNTEMLEPW